MKRWFVALSFGVILVGCGRTSQDRATYVSSCAPLASPVDLGGDPLAQEILLSDVEWHTTPETDMSKKPKPHPVALFPIKIEGKIQSDLIGMRLQTGGGAGFEKDYPYPPTGPTFTDEEGLTYRQLPNRKLGSKRVEKNGITTLTSRMLETGINWDDKKKVITSSEKNLVTSVIVGLEGGRLRSLEVNWPISLSDHWRKGPYLLPALQHWSGKNERLCLKSAVRR